MSSPRRRPSAIADDELTAAIGADRVLMLRLLRDDLRPAFEALWQLDAAMGEVVARSTQPALGAVKLAWWGERLDELDQGIVPAEPRLRAASEHLLSRGITGSDLATIEDGWATLLDAEPNPERIADRGSKLFRIGGRLLGADDAKLDDAGAIYALVFVARRGIDDYLHVHGVTDAVRLSRYRYPRALRPLTALARLALLDMRRGPPFEPEGTPPRLAAMLRHQWTGIIAWRR